MARGTTLVRLLDLLRATCRLSQNTAHNEQVRDNQVTLLQGTQEWLWDDFDWPHLRVERQFEAANGQRYYSLPDDIGIERVLEIQFRYGNRWGRMCPGIDLAQYNMWDSDSDQRSWPVTNWAISENEEIEMWPIPDQDANDADKEGYFKVIGIRKLRPLVDSDDVCDLDDRLIVDYAAAEHLAASDKERSKTILARANSRYAKLRGQLMPRRSFKMGGNGGFRTKDLLRGPPRVHLRTS
jgi:hypothetical protein